LLDSLLQEINTIVLLCYVYLCFTYDGLIVVLSKCKLLNVL